MERKRVAGRFVGEPGRSMPKPRSVGAPRPAYCRTFARARFAEALPEIAAKLIDEAAQGSVPHLKALLELTGLNKGDVVPRATKRRGRSLEAILMEQWRQDEEDETGEGDAGSKPAGDGDCGVEGV